MLGVAHVYWPRALAGIAFSPSSDELCCRYPYNSQSLVGGSYNHSTKNVLAFLDVSVGTLEGKRVALLHANTVDLATKLFEMTWIIKKHPTNKLYCYNLIIQEKTLVDPKTLENWVNTSKNT